MAVSASGRNVSPASTSGVRSKRAKPAPIEGGRHTGISAYGRTPRSRRKPSSTQVKVVSAVVTARIPWSSSSMGRGMRGPTTLNSPAVASSPRRIVHSVKSRTSMICTGSDGSPGASTSPPRWMRTGQ